MEVEKAIGILGNVPLDDKLNPEYIKQVQEAFSVVKTALERPKGEWIPIKDVSELPKNKMLWVTTTQDFEDIKDIRCVEKLHWDMTEWSSNRVAKMAVAYMYMTDTPEPYYGTDERGG